MKNIGLTRCISAKAENFTTDRGIQLRRRISPMLRGCPRNDMSGVVLFCPHGLYSLRSMVVLRAANQNQMIAGGNHTLISSLGQRRYIV